MVGVISVGVLPGILVAIGLSVLRLLALVARPRDALLGQIEGQESLVDVGEYPEARPIPGLVVYRYDSSPVFFNADYFKERVRRALAEATDRPRWFLYDAEGSSLLDVTGAEVLGELHDELAGQG